MHTNTRKIELWEAEQIIDTLYDTHRKTHAHYVDTQSVTLHDTVVPLRGFSVTAQCTGVEVWYSFADDSRFGQAAVYMDVDDSGNVGYYTDANTKLLFGSDRKLLVHSVFVSIDEPFGHSVHADEVIVLPESVLSEANTVMIAEYNGPYDRGFDAEQIEVLEAYIQMRFNGMKSLFSNQKDIGEYLTWWSVLYTKKALIEYDVLCKHATPKQLALMQGEMI